MKKIAFQIMGDKTSFARQEASGTEQLTIHPLAERFPDLPAEDFDKLKVSIQKMGLIDPLVINDQGQILDGRHRYRACQELGIKPSTVYLQAVLGADHNKVTEARFIFDVNYHRRHLTEDQRVALAEEFIPLFREQAEANLKATQQKGSKKRLGGSTQAKSTRKQLAEVAKVNQEKAKQVIKLYNESPELLDQVKTGEKKLVEAVRDLNESKPNIVAEINQLHKEISATGRTSTAEHVRRAKAKLLPTSKDIQPIEQWKLVKQVEKPFARLVEKLFTKFHPSQHRKIYQIISDVCARQLDNAKAEAGDE